MQTLTIKISLTDDYKAVGDSTITVNAGNISRETLESLAEIAARDVASQAEAKQKASLGSFTATATQLPAAGDAY